jgi:outer membrane protein TolC
MRGVRSVWWRYGARLLGGIAASALLPFGPGARAAEAELGAPVAAAPAVNVQVLDLKAFRQMALESQPAIAAARASLAAAVARSQAVDNLRVPTFLARDLPIRRKQAALGVTIAEAAVARAEADTLYGVTFSYLSAAYAAEQRRVADKVDADLQEFRKGAQQAITAGSTTVSNIDLDKIDAYLLLARSRREEAVQGEQRALRALREAVGGGPDCPQLLAGRFALTAPACAQDVVAAALARRPELVQAATAAQVTEFEVSAQKATCLPTARTFAAGSDIHAQPVPQGSYEETYRPGASALEMPTQMAGSRGDRVEQARAYSARAEAVAEQAFLRYVEASRRWPQLEEAAAKAKKVFQDIQDKFKKGVGRITADEWLRAGSLATELRVEANRAHYQLRLALAQLERVTAGGFCAGFESEAPAPAPQGGASNNKNANKGPG